ncbi:phage holin family protein [Cellulosimicrobium cellulans]|uniref:phage holin family protein n=1 Tax=Cellulosimicrobium cellulans TaxID=1710 RepID=UPI0019663254|nr:phage holin family protein [Cellulosimicrobium cellulans]MBN0039304.1 phage holin family protein [Cellulosimicrobium cellulans]
MSDWIDGRIPPEEQKPTVGQLVERLSEQATRLVRSEIALAKAELTTKAKHAGIGIGMLVVGGVLVLYGLGFLLHSAMEGLATVMPVWLAALIVGLVLVLVAGTLAFVGVKQLQRGVPPTPTGAVDSIKEDVATIKEGLRP